MLLTRNIIAALFAIVLIYFINRPNPIVLEKDGKINFLRFDMIPDTNVVSGSNGLVGIMVSQSSHSKSL